MGLVPGRGDAPLTYEFKDPQPWEHQRKAFERFKDLPFCAICFEQRCGKSKTAIDLVAYDYERFLSAGGWDRGPGPWVTALPPAPGATGLLIVAMPGRVHRNWIVNEIPSHLPDRIPRMGVVWEAKGITYDKHSRIFRGRLWKDLEPLLSFQGLSILAVNGEALPTVALRHYLSRFFTARKAVAVIDDEFTLVNRTPGIERTRVMENIRKHKCCARRIIMDGTPNEGSPLDCFAPYRFLSSDIWGTDSFTVFKNRYARWKEETDWKRGHTYKVLDKGEDGTESPFINMDELRERMAPITMRVLRKEVFDMPEKVYQPITYEPSKEQRRVYDSLVEEFEAELHTGHKVSAPLALTRYLRMQQVLTNIWPSEKLPVIHEACQGDGCPSCDDLGVTIENTKPRLIDEKEHPRLEVLTAVLRSNGSSGIVWARFTRDVDEILGVARSLGRSACRYDGRVSNEAKDDAQDGFQSGRYDLLVGKKKSGGRGIKLSKAGWICTYTEEFSLLSRLQGEDRAEEAGKTTGTGIIDILAENTIDDLIIYPALRYKKDIADFINGDRKGAWI